MYDEEQQNREQSPDVIGSMQGIKNIADQSNHLKNVMNSGENIAKEASKDGTKKAMSEATRSAAKEGVKEGAKEGAKAAATTAAETGASATGVGAVAVIGEKALTLGKKGIDDATKAATGTSIKFRDILLVFAFFIMIFMYIITCGMHGNVGASSEKYHEDQYNQTSVKKGFFGFARSIFHKFFDAEDEELGEYRSQYPLQESLEKNLNILNKAFQKAYEIAELEIQGIIAAEEYDYLLTMESFYGNGYPFDNVNYAEIISLISQKDTYNIEYIKYNVFKKLFKPSLNNEKLSFLYKMKVEEDWKTVRFHMTPEGEEIRLADGESPPNDENQGGYTYEKDLRYGKVILARYDLKALYEMIELEPNEKNAHWDINNIDMLDEQEIYLRFYARDFDLGTTERTVWYHGFDKTDQTFSEEEYEELEEYLKLYDGDLSEAIKRLLKSAFTKLGTTYSQDLRDQEGYFDCSSFVAWCYRQIGVEFGGYSPVAANICKYLEQTSHKVSSSYDGNNLMPGDLIFYSSEYNGRYKNITHVALYVGNGKIVDASYSKGQVVYRDIWGKNQIVSICRPLS